MSAGSEMNKPFLNDSATINSDYETIYSNLFNSMNEGVALYEMIFSSSGRPVDYVFIDINPAFEILTGLKKENVKGRRVLEIMPETEKYWIEKYSEAVLSGKPASFQNFSSALQKHFLVNAYPAGGNRFAVIFTDITEIKKIEKKQSQSEKLEAIGQFAGGIAHDFNNQLSAMLGFTELLMLEINDDRQRSYLDQIINSASGSAKLTKQLLSFSRNNLIEVSKSDIHKMLDEFRELLHRTFDKKIRVSLHLDASNHFIDCDLSQIQNSLLTLALNAQDAMPEGGDLIIETSNEHLSADFIQSHGGKISEGNYFRISVSDSGSGIPPEEQNKVFEPFFTNKEKDKGTGMGLFSVYTTVKRHKGLILLYSEPARGTIFTIYLPAGASEMQGSIAAGRDNDKTVIKNENSPLLKIMVVDDDLPILNMLRKMIEKIGYQAVCCAGGNEAIELYGRSSKEIDIVIMDLVLPDFNGGELYKKLKKINPDIKCILASGFSFASIDEDITDLGYSAFIQKPYRLTELQDLIREVSGNVKREKSGLNYRQ